MYTGEGEATFALEHTGEPIRTVELLPALPAAEAQAQAARLGGAYAVRTQPLTPRRALTPSPLGTRFRRALHVTTPSGHSAGRGHARACATSRRRGP